MLTVNGQKMSKSLGNSFLPWELITGEHPMLEHGFSPMTIRFFMLQSHYASTLDFSNDALNAAKKGYNKLVNGIRVLETMSYPAGSVFNGDMKLSDQIDQMCDNCYHAMNDDFNTALTIGHLFNLIKKVNSLNTGQIEFEQISKEVFDKMKAIILGFTNDVLGLKQESSVNGEHILSMLLDEYKSAKEAKDYEKVDVLREKLKNEGLIIKDMKGKVDWAYEE